MIYETIGDRLKYSLNIRKLTQKEFAQRINITESAMSRYISDERVPRADTIVSICRSLGVSADWLLGMTDLEKGGRQIT